MEENNNARMNDTYYTVTGLEISNLINTVLTRPDELCAARYFLYPGSARVYVMHVYNRDDRSIYGDANLHINYSGLIERSIKIRVTYKFNKKFSRALKSHMYWEVRGGPGLRVNEAFTLLGAYTFDGPYKELPDDVKSVFTEWLLK